MDVSSSGLVINVRASRTFPSGFVVTQVASDADPFDIPAITTAVAEMNINGDLVSYSSPVPIEITMNVTPGGIDDRQLGILLNANRAAKGRRVARDVITIVAAYPDGGVVTLSNGVISGGTPGRSTASNGRIKSKAYTFTFSDISNFEPGTV